MKLGKNENAENIEDLEPLDSYDKEIDFEDSEYFENQTEFSSR